MSQFAPSKYQAAIFDKVEGTTENLIIEAVAGSGKTTTIVEAVEFIPATKSILFLAFNAAIAKELASKLPSNCEGKTFHKAGLGAWLSYLGGKKDLNSFIDGEKMARIVKSKFFGLEPDEIGLYLGFVLKMVGHAKNAGIGCLIENTPAAWLALAEHFDVSIDSEDATIERGIEIAQKALKVSVDFADRVIDFDDMIYMPLLMRCNFRKFDVVIVDEAQDTNGVQRAILKKITKPSGRFIAVGDPSQAIYGFRGADSDAMEIIARDFACAKMPLTVSYRCPKAVVRKAQEVVSHIEAFEGAAEGEVLEMLDYVAADFQAGDAVLCRNVAPLVSMAYGLLTRDIACQVLGRDIGKGLVALIEKLKAKGIDALLVKLDEWLNREVEAAREKSNEAKIESLNDTVDCLRAFVGMLDENHRTIPALIRRIESLFASDEDNDDSKLVTLCSAHKSKGLEWSTVYLLDSDALMPSKYARKDWQKVQEQNLIYVAYTRAKASLRFITSGSWKVERAAKIAA